MPLLVVCLATRVSCSRFFAGRFPHRGNLLFCCRFKPGSSKANSICIIGWGLYAGLELCHFRPWEVYFDFGLTIFESRLDFICSLVVIMSAGLVLVEPLIDNVEAEGNVKHAQQRKRLLRVHLVFLFCDETGLMSRRGGDSRSLVTVAPARKPQDSVEPSALGSTAANAVPIWVDSAVSALRTKHRYSSWGG